MELQKSHPNDAINVAPDLHTILFEDNDMRVLKVSVAPGATANMHWHPKNINYILSSGTLQIEKEDGNIVELELQEGQVTSSPAASHAVKNIGTTTVETVQVELKN